MSPRPDKHAFAVPAPATAAHPSIAHFTGAYPGQAVVKGSPNRARRAAHCERGAEIARRSGNTVVEAAWLRARARLISKMGASVADGLDAPVQEASWP